MAAKPPVIVLDLFPEERRRLLELLESMTPEQWDLATPCPDWSVKDIVAHVIGDDFGILSGGRDGFPRGWFGGSRWEDIVDFVNKKNEAWVDAMRGLSAAVLLELLSFVGERTQGYYETLDLMSMGPNVAWAGKGPHPLWLHIAREYTERWLHQMQVREAVGAPGLYEPALYGPVLASFVYALPVAYASTDAPAGLALNVVIEAEAGGAWNLVRRDGDWALGTGEAAGAAAVVRLDQVTAWKLWTRGIGPEEARMQVRVEGDQRLGEPVLGAVAIIA